jgi:hypothetical protein
MFRRDGLATENAWGPMSNALVSMFASKLYYTALTIDAPGGVGTATRSGLALPSWGEFQSDPFWSQDGKFLVFTSFATPNTDPNNPTGLNGDMKRGGQIAIASSDGTVIHDDARVLVPRQANVTSYYPAISNDSKFIVFNQSTCGAEPDPVRGAGYGNQSCDGYDDSTATLWLTTPEGRTPVPLTNANGQPMMSNSWPRWSPDSGRFRGKNLYWVAFSSRRAYGLQVNYGAAPSVAKPQLWFTGVVSGDEFLGDPSFAPVWLPGQNRNQSVPFGNHVPQWVAVAVPIIQ